MRSCPGCGSQQVRINGQLVHHEGCKGDPVSRGLPNCSRCGKPLHPDEDIIVAVDRSHGSHKFECRIQPVDLSNEPGEGLLPPWDEMLAPAFQEAQEAIREGVEKVAEGLMKGVEERVEEMARLVTQEEADQFMISSLKQEVNFLRERLAEAVECLLLEAHWNTKHGFPPGWKAKRCLTENFHLLSKDARLIARDLID